MPQKSSSMEHKVILLPNVKFWWGYNADDPHPLVDVSSSQRMNLGSAPPDIPVDFIRYNHVKYARFGTSSYVKFINPHKKSRQSLRQKICRKALFTSLQSDPDQNQEWLVWVVTKWWDKFRITNFSLALSGWATSFDFRFHLVIEAIIVFGLGTYQNSTHWQPNA